MTMQSKHVPMPEELWADITEAAGLRAKRLGMFGKSMPNAEFIRQAVRDAIAAEKSMAEKAAA